jgi:hypothetical protein
MSRETNQPCPTLYVNNIESKIKKIGEYSADADRTILLRGSMPWQEVAHPSDCLVGCVVPKELRKQLYALFTPYGKVYVNYDTSL